MTIGIVFLLPQIVVAMSPRMGNTNFNSILSLYIYSTYQSWLFYPPAHCEVEAGVEGIADQQFLYVSLSK